MRYSDRNAVEEYVGQQVEVLHWAAAIDDPGVPMCHPCPVTCLEAIIAFCRLSLPAQHGVVMLTTFGNLPLLLVSWE